MTKIESLILVNQVTIMLALSKLCHEQMPRDKYGDIVHSLHRGIHSTQTVVEQAVANGELE